MFKVSVQNKRLTERFLNKKRRIKYSTLTKYGEIGAQALSNATPVDTGTTALCWYYEIKETDNGASITWSNSNVVDGQTIAVLLQYGHGTRNGGYVQGVDYINPALRPVFDKLAKDAWSEVISP